MRADKTTNARNCDEFTAKLRAPAHECGKPVERGA